MLEGLWVSSHTPLRGYSVPSLPTTPRAPVSSHTPLRGYSRPPAALPTNPGVSSHTPLRGYSSTGTVRIVRTLQFQVIPPCGGILSKKEDLAKTVVVSSHTPLRGYSATDHSPCSPMKVSSHTPLRGYSSRKAHGGKNPHCFKSYPLAGVFRSHGLPGGTGRKCFKSYPLAGVFRWPRALLL